jgi:methionyl aminopeptidase
MAQIELKTPVELAKMRRAGRTVAEVLRLLSDIAEPGMTTAQLEGIAEQYITSQGGVASFKGYRGFPAAICASVNEEIVHGVPGPRKLRSGDLLKLDVGVLWEGFHADAAVTIPIGDVAAEARELTEATREALQAGIRAIRSGVRVDEISGAIEQTAGRYGFSVVREYVGHGIGRQLHEAPRVPNYVASRLLHSSPVLEKGAVVAIEPMLNAGTHRTKLGSDGYAVVTRDGELSAHFEHTVAVDDGGPVILTVP